ncbi:unnamed protein product [Sympodiomycopsis kandeliae]
MKLTPELITAVGSSLNTLKDREIELRGHKIPAIENLGVTRDQVDTLDLTDNDIMTLANFPHLDRLAHLLLSNNLISRIDPRLAFSIPRLTTLVLTNNQLSSFHQLNALSRFPLLEYVTLIGNPIARENYYREFVVWKCKSIRVLDFKRVKAKERELAKSLMETSDGRPSSLAHSLSSSSSSSDKEHTSNRTAAEAIAQNQGAAGRLMTKEERKKLAQAIENSDSLEEIRRLEERLRLGYAIEDTDTSGSNKKRKEVNGDDTEEQPTGSKSNGQPAEKKKR